MNKRKVEPQICTEKTYNQMLICIALATIISVVNLDYIFIIKLDNLDVIQTIFLIINFLIINSCNYYIFDKIHWVKNLSLKKYKRNIFYLNLTNVVNWILYTMDFEVFARNIFVLFWTIETFIYSIVFVVVRIVDTTNGMEEYLKGNED